MGFEKFGSPEKQKVLIGEDVEKEELEGVEEEVDDGDGERVGFVDSEQLPLNRQNQAKA